MPDTATTEPPLAALAALLAHPRFVPLTSTYPLPAPFRATLARQLNAWREERYGKRRLLSPKVFLPDRQLNALADYGGAFLRAERVTPELILRVTPWDLASEDDVREVAEVIERWCAEVAPRLGWLWERRRRGGRRRSPRPSLPRRGVQSPRQAPCPPRLAFWAPMLRWGRCLRKHNVDEEECLRSSDVRLNPASSSFFAFSTALDADAYCIA